jgi:hypothetical protein
LQKLITPALTVTPNTVSNECNPSSNQNLKQLSNLTHPTWSIGIWTSENVLNFVSNTQIGVIDTNDPDFGDFQIWISPCYVDAHGYSDGVSFWPLQAGIQSNGISIILGQVTTIQLPKDSGLWGLGNQFKP